MVFMFGLCDGIYNLRNYVRRCALPSLSYDPLDPFLPPIGHKSHQNHLTVRPEVYRRLETILSIEHHISDPLETWLDTNIPTTHLRVKEPDPITGDRLTIPYPIPADFPWTLEKHPVDMSRFTPWIDRLPLATVKRILHLSIPEARGWSFHYPSSFPEPNSKIFCHYLWSMQKSRGGTRLEPSVIEEAETRKTLIAIQPPWILTQRDLEEFVGCQAFPPVVVPGNIFPAELTSKHRLWGKLWDLCVREKTHYFVISSYSYWVFGVFSPGWTVGFTTGVYDANLWNPTVIEILTFWIASGMGLPGGFVPPKVGTEVDTSRYETPSTAYDILCYGQAAVPEPVQISHPQIPLPPSADELPDPADSESDWAGKSSDAGSSAGVCPSLYTLSDGGVPDRLSIIDEEKPLTVFEDWMRKGVPGCQIPEQYISVSTPAFPFVHHISGRDGFCGDWMM